MLWNCPLWQKPHVVLPVRRTQQQEKSQVEEKDKTSLPPLVSWGNNYRTLHKEPRSVGSAFFERILGDLVVPGQKQVKGATNQGMTA